MLVGSEAAAVCWRLEPVHREHQPRGRRLVRVPGQHRAQDQLQGLPLRTGSVDNIY